MKWTVIQMSRFSATEAAAASPSPGSVRAGYSCCVCRCCYLVCSHWQSEWVASCVSCDCHYLPSPLCLSSWLSWKQYSRHIYFFCDDFAMFDCCCWSGLQCQPESTRISVMRQIHMTRSTMMENPSGSLSAAGFSDDDGCSYCRWPCWICRLCHWIWTQSTMHWRWTVLHRCYMPTADHLQCFALLCVYDALYVFVVIFADWQWRPHRCRHGWIPSLSMVCPLSACRASLC
mmetsp:Transcript_59039/g.93963  ORF Transcript_59039/g.93963 Transcript_59039/m.93963 type:complete len:231 (+) Transcript_59039:29-721(+)